MDQIFWIQTVTAFVIGGLAVSTLTIFAEKAPRQLAGIILALPTNMVIGLFFLGLVNSPESVAESIDGVPLTLGGAILYAVAYLWVVCFIFSSKASNLIAIPVCLGAALMSWLLFPFLLAQFGTPSLGVGVILFLLVMITTQWLLIHLAKNQEPEPQKSNSFKWGTLIFRAILAGTVIVIALIVSKVLNPFWGVIIGSSFPAAYTATLIALHLQNGSKSLLNITRMLPLGTSGQLFYVFAIAYTYPLQGLWWGTLAAYLVTIIFYILLHYGMKLFKL